MPGNILAQFPAASAAAAAANPLATAARSPARKPKAVVAKPSRAKKEAPETGTGALQEEDRIAVAKRVQMNKQLGGARGRAGVAVAVAVAGVKPPPPNAKRSNVGAKRSHREIADVVESGAAGDVSVGSMQKPGVSAREENAPEYSKPPPPTKSRIVQRARKSTGGSARHSLGGPPAAAPTTTTKQ
ncbi:hypothetical protein LPJ66_004335 [Kickxella alabastrina]|uniref:Uncharacterized protein n=1 Tax=Kickxella alabastrina TaxID=61397 RepID=A0ACC1INS2_9FUNG|nr:hypothetical protein LPJ66_004335 [Kickxella alabastrina]